MSDAPPVQTTETPQADTGAEAGAAPVETSLLTGGAEATATETTAADATAAAAEAEKAAAPVVPDEYEFTAPEIDGKPLEIDAEKFSAFKTIAKDAGLTQAQFDAVTKSGMASLAEAAAAPHRVWLERKAAWANEIRADPEIGGDNLAPNLAYAAKVLDQFGSDELRQAMVITGAGDNPAVIRAFIAIGRAMGDAEGLIRGKPAGGAKSTNPEQGARNFYNEAGGSYPALTG